MSTKYKDIYQRSITDSEGFWSDVSKDIFWYKKPTKILNSNNPPFYKWFSDGVTNTCYNAIDLHVKNGKGEKIAIIYDSPITNSQKKITYGQLKDLVSTFAGALKNQGIKKGDRIIIYMPMIPEAVIAMLACGRIGAVHSVVFGGFAPNELASRIDDSKAKIILSASCGYEPGRTVEYKPLLNKAIELAKQSSKAGLVINTVGVGSKSGSLIPIINDKQSSTQYMRDNEGKLITSTLNESNLRAIAKFGGGSYFWFANSADSYLEILDYIGELEKKTISTHEYSEYENRYQFPLLVSLFSFIISFFIKTRVK